MEENYKLCPKCGFKMKEYYCMSCGYVDKEQYDIEYKRKNTVAKNKKLKVEYHVTIKDVVFFVLAVLNFSLIFHRVLDYMAFWLVFGALSQSATKYYLILGAGVIYIIFSIIFLLKSIWNLIRGVKILRIVYVIAVISSFAYFIFYILNLKYHFI